ncbi:hypothetical protein FLONG3_5244 [Fusarium longipes]|uniref:Uncharacterized protein n=1 Tax=Fusarium longipes TaxID=694270 RepID=A0A395SV38_9HYPO|nr:hypothetical protein FLONG3_5244 [Fusarium longipes]
MTPSRLILRPVVRIPFMRPQLRLASTNPDPKHIYSDGNLGGPGGQQPPPEAPGGPDALKRNWVPIAAAVGVVVGGFMMLLPKKGNPPDRTLQSYKDLKDRDSPEGLKEFSGRKPNPIGPWRTE